MSFLKKRVSLVFIHCVLFIAPRHSGAEFELNFQPNPNIVDSWANSSCDGTGAGGGGMGGGGMMGFGPGCGSDVFLQELVEDNGVQYYHVIVGDPDVDDFAMEFYMRAGGCCWWEDGGMGGGGMGGMGGGDAPFSSSDGDLTDRLANAWEPLAPPAVSGTGTGNPGRMYMIQINRDSQMEQTFLKSLEANKPRITQVIDDGQARSVFDLDMSNADFTAPSDPALFINTFEIYDGTDPAGFASFDMSVDGQDVFTSAGRFSYTPGAGAGGSSGTFTYEDGGFPVESIDWLSYCDPGQNPDHQCVFSPGGGGGMGGGGMGGGGMGGGM